MEMEEKAQHSSSASLATLRPHLTKHQPNEMEIVEVQCTQKRSISSKNAIMILCSHNIFDSTAQHNNVHMHSLRP